MTWFCLIAACEILNAALTPVLTVQTHLNWYKTAAANVFRSEQESHHDPDCFMLLNFICIFHTITFGTLIILILTAANEATHLFYVCDTHRGGQSEEVASVLLLLLFWSVHQEFLWLHPL